MSERGCISATSFARNGREISETIVEINDLRKPMLEINGLRGFTSPAPLDTRFAGLRQ